MRWYEIYESMNDDELMRQTLLDLLTPLYRNKMSKVPVKSILGQLSASNDFSGKIVDYDMLSTLINDDPKKRFSKMLNADSLQSNDNGELELIFAPPNDHSKEQLQPEEPPMDMEAEFDPSQNQGQNQGQDPNQNANSMGAQNQGGNQQGMNPGMGNQPKPDMGMGNQPAPDTGFAEFNKMAASGQNNEKQNGAKVDNLASNQLGKGK